MKHILCFGDSNTWGYTPGTGKRYDEDTRWTCIAQKALGTDYRLHEDGLNNRTTAFHDPWTPGRVGTENIYASLVSQKPLDMVVLSLGTNDLKFTDANGSAHGLSTLVKTMLGINQWESGSVFPNGVRILLVSPIAVGPIADEDPYSSFAGKRETSLTYAERCKRIASELNIDFLDAAAYAEPSETDGVHMTPEGHKALGLAIADRIKAILG